MNDQEQIDNAFRELLVDRELGKEARNFLTGPIGQYMSGCIEHEIAQAQTKLATVAPWRRRRIMELQNQIWRAQTLRGWFADLIINGNQAAQALAEDSNGDDE